MVAVAFAQAINCTGTSDVDARPCVKCSSCVRIARGEHPDVLLVEPDKSSARPVIKIQVVRELIRQVRFKPYEAARRVIIIDDVESMQTAAANALLKTLEEPSGETIFVLVTAQLAALLPTIRSRCQILRFAPLGREEVAAVLRTHGVPEDVVDVAASFGEGSPGAAIRLAEGDGLAARREFVSAVADATVGGPFGPLQLAGKYARTNPGQLRDLMDGLKTFYRDVALVASGVGSDRVVNVDVLGLISETAGKLTVDDAIGHIGRIGEAQRAMTGYVDQRLLLEDLLFSLRARRTTDGRARQY
jgi:DNA polymerase-3 subunit delta'